MRLLLLIVVIFLPCITFGNIVITEVMCNPPGSDTDGEWVKIKNIGDGTIDLTGWKFNDGSNHNLNVPPENGGVGDMQIPAGESALLANKAGEVTGASTIIDTVMSLSNSGDTLKIIDSNGTEVHIITYKDSDVVEGESCFTYDSEATTATDGNTEIQKNIITTVNEVTRYRTVEIQPPQDILIRQLKDRVVLVGSMVSMPIESYDATGKAISPKCHVIFGDGQENNSCNSEHIYEFAGTYIVNMGVKKNSLQGESQVSIVVMEPKLELRIDDAYTYVEIINNADFDIELSGWLFKVDYKKFTIPNGTIIPANGSIKISANTLQIDIAKYGGVVRLVDAFGTIVADSSEYVEMVDNITEDPIKILASTEIVQQEILVLPPEQEEAHEEVERLVRATSVQDVALATSGIIGMPIATVETGKERRRAENTAVVRESRNIQQLASVSTANISGDSLGILDILPQESGKWLVGLLALLGIAVLPVLMMKKEDDLIGVTPKDNNEEVEKFTIEELK